MRQYGTISLGIPENIPGDSSSGQITSFSRIAQIGGFGGSVWQKNSETEQQPQPSPSSLSLQQPSSTTTTTKFTDYFSPALKISIKYPIDWTKTETANSIALTSRDKDERLDIFYHQNIPLFPTASETLEKNAQKAIDDQTFINNIEIKDSKDITIGGDGLPAKKIVYTYSSTTTPTATDTTPTTTENELDEYSVMATIVINKNDLYKIFFSTKADQFDSRLPVVEEIIDSIRFTESAPDGNIIPGGISTTTPTTSPTSTTTTSTPTSTQRTLPVVLIHGWSSNSQDWNPWINLLQNDGIKYYPITFQESDDSCGSSKDHANELAKKIEQIKQETGKDKVNIVGYSKGGLDARVYLAESGTDDDVSNLIMIGTPNAGTSAANLVDYCTPGLYDVRPGAPATIVQRNPNVNYYTIAGDWSPEIGGMPFIEGNDDQIVPVSSVESESYFTSLGRTAHSHGELIGLEEYNLAKPILLGGAK